MNQTVDLAPLDADSTNEFEELNNLISSTVFASITSNRNQVDEDCTINSNVAETDTEGLNNTQEDIEWNKLNHLFHSSNGFIIPISNCNKKEENKLSVSTASTSNESQAELLSQDSSPETSPFQPISSSALSLNTSPLKLGSSSYVSISQQQQQQSSFIPINKFDDNTSLQFPYYSKYNTNYNSQKGIDSEKSIIHLNDIINCKDHRTTLMIRHIPNKYTLKLFTNEINQKFKNKYDVFYLPIDYINNCNLGFAFINFVDPLHIVEFYEAFRGKKWKKYYSDKICELAYAKIQGKQNLMVHFEKGSVLNYQTEEKKPLILPTPTVEKMPKISLPIKHFDKFKECFPKAHFNYDKDRKHIVFENCSH